jgi:hypothetical protein
MLDSGYTSFGVHMHLFALSDLDCKSDPIERIKLDLLFDQSFPYDRYLFGISDRDHTRLTAFIQII